MASRKITAFRTTLGAILLCAVLQAFPVVSSAHDFGGSTTGGASDSPPPSPPPCDGQCGCEGPGGSSSGAESGEDVPQSCPNPDEPPNRSCDPVSYWNGSESLSEVDLKVAGVMPIHITRKYDSLSNFDSPVGYGWIFVHDRRLFEYPDGSVVVRYGCGNRDRYTASGGGYVSTAGGMRSTLVQNPDGTWELRYANGTRDRFNSQGSLTAFLDARGNRHEFTYDAAGKLPLTGTSKASATPGQPMIVSYVHRLTRIDERNAGGALTGRYVTFSYNVTTGRLLSVTANDGRSVSYVHDTAGGLTKGNLVQVSGLEGVTQTYGYTDANDEHNLTSITRAPGRTPVTNVYDNQDRVIRQEEGTRKIEFNYQTPLTKTVVTKTIKDQNGLNPYTVVTTYDFDSTGRITKITDAQGHEQRFVYNTAKRLERSEIWQKNGAAVTLLRAKNYAYDTAGHRTSEAVALDSGETVTKTWTFDHDWVASEQRVSSASPSKIFRTEYTFFFDSDGRPVAVKDEKRRKDDGSFQTTSYTYDAQNRLLTTTYPDGVKLINEYTGEFLTKTYFEVGGVEVSFFTKRFGYDAVGNQTERRDARNNLTQLAYDDLGRLVSITNPLGEERIETYADLLLTQVEIGRTTALGEGQVRKSIYDARGRLIEVQRKDDSGVFQTFEAYELDSEGQRLSTTDALGHKTKFAYDSLGRVISKTDPLNKTVQYGYNAAGDLTQTTDPFGRQITYDFDDLSRQIAIVELGVSPNPRTEYGYDAADNLTSVRDPGSHTTLYTFDSLSRNTRITSPLGQFVQHEYDGRDRVENTVTARGQRIAYSYEAWGPVKQERHFPTTSASTPDRTIDYGYDVDGNPTSVSDSAVQVAPIVLTTYDALSRRYDETMKYLPGGDRVLENRYDRYGNRSTLTLQDGGAITNTYTYDKRNRLAAATLSGQSISLNYLASDELQSVTFPSGVSRSYTYEDNGLVETIALSNSGGALATFEFTYDDAFNVESIEDNDGVHEFAYDGLDRLTATTRPSGLGLTNESYGYDSVGNREIPANGALYGYDSNNRITASPGVTYAFDDDGNMASRSDGSTLTHDVRNRLTTFSKSTTVASYLYDPLGRRLKKTVNGTSTWYVWDGENLIGEYSGAGVRQKDYAYLDREFIPALITDSNGAYFVHPDQVGTPRVLTGSSAQVVWNSRHDAFGQTLVDEDVDGNSITVTLNMRFAGQYFDAESGFHYNLIRDYDPATGRFLQMDPLLKEQLQHPYLYALSNPLRFIDPDGRQPLACLLAAPEVKLPPGSKGPIKKAACKDVKGCGEKCSCEYDVEFALCAMNFRCILNAKAKAEQCLSSC
jgi:RHS repeat-associated protein